MQCERRGRRLGAPYHLPLRGRWLLPEAKGGGREMKKSLPQSNALHLTAPSRSGRKQRAIRESPLQPVGNGLDRSAKSHRNRRAGVEPRPYNGSSRRRPVSPPSQREVALGILQIKTKQQTGGCIYPPVFSDSKGYRSPICLRHASIICIHAAVASNGIKSDCVFPCRISSATRVNSVK